MTDLGTDISTPIDPDSGLPGLDPFFGTVSGRDQLVQALVRRIVTPVGGLIDDGSYGYDVRAHLNDAAPRPSQIAAQVRAQWLADERVLDARADVTFADGVLTVRGTVLDDEGPFALVLAIDALTVTLLEPS